MANLGIHLRQEWVAHCLGEVSNGSGNGDGGRQRSTQQAKEEIYRTFLSCDLREAGAACFPEGVAGMAKERMKGKIVVQASGNAFFFFVGTQEGEVLIY